MALDVVRSNSLVGKDAGLTDFTLGPPEGLGLGVWRYPIGQCTGFGWHDTDLMIYLDRSYMVTETQIKHVSSVQFNR
jgi:hypothetical protein